MGQLTRRALAGAAVAALALLVTSGCGGGPGRRPAAALDTLRRGEPVVVVHVVAPGETLSDIALAWYGDPARAEQIAAANGLPAAAVPVPGTRLRLELAPAEWQRARQRGVATEAYNRGVDALAAGDLVVAEAAFREALAVDPGLDDARYDLALVLLRRGRDEQAEPLLREVLARRPGDRDARLALAGCLFHQTRFDAAADLYRGLLADRPGDRDAAYGLARALDAGGRTREALAAWRAYLALDGGSRRADEARRRIAALRASVDAH